MGTADPQIPPSDVNLLSVLVAEPAPTMAARGKGAIINADTGAAKFGMPAMSHDGYDDLTELPARVNIDAPWVDIHPPGFRDRGKASITASTMAGRMYLHLHEYCRPSET